MRKDLNGQRAKQEPKEFLGAYSSAVDEIIKKAQNARNPSGFQRVANGAVGQTIAPDNAQNFA